MPVPFSSTPRNGSLVAAAGGEMSAAAASATLRIPRVRPQTRSKTKPMANVSGILLGIAFSVHFAYAAEPVALQRHKVPSPPWPAGDERGMAQPDRAGDLQRCAWHMAQPGRKSYELSQVRSNTMPLSPFAGPYAVKPEADRRHPGHGARVQHRVARTRAPIPASRARSSTRSAISPFAAAALGRQVRRSRRKSDLLRRLHAEEVKPTPDSPLLKLGIEKSPPIITSAVLLDAKSLCRQAASR